MGSYRVSLEINLGGDSPLDVAKTLENWLRSNERFQYYVQDKADGVIYSVDLDEEDWGDEPVVIVHDYSPIIKS